MVNQKSKSDKEQYFIPLEVTPETIITTGYKDSQPQWLKIGNRMIKGILIPVTKEQYCAYMQPEWREDKREQRLGEKRKKREKAKEECRVDKSVQGWDTAVSFDDLTEMEYGFDVGVDIEGAIEKEEAIEALYQALDKLEQIDQEILKLIMDGYSEAAIAKQVGMSQKGVNKRKHKAYARLQEDLKDYR